MAKKRFVIAILLVFVFVLLSTSAFAGCCRGIIGCSRAFFSSECSELATFETQECEEIQDCDIVACCHNIPGIPKATYRSTCLGMTPPPLYHFIKAFTTNPAAESAYANSLCGGALPPCSSVNCEGQNSDACMCGSSVTNDSNPFCCSRDSSVFPSFGACSSSPSCRAGNFYNIHGMVLSPDGFPIAGAEVRAGGKQVLTDEFGNFTVELLPDLSSGTVVAIKNSTINSTTYSISGADRFNLVITLNILAGAPTGLEICTNGADDDGDQFGWNSSAEGLGDVADRCDPDCAGTFGITLSRTVTKTYYDSTGEYYTDPAFGLRDKCSDRFDNDCDGLMDCADPECSASPACMATFCGDGSIQFPNADGQYEQCDMNYDTLVGNDSLCPGKCVQAGETKECTCQYEAICGNGVIDEPLEDCDGVFDAARARWDTSRYNTGSDCTIGLCGAPDSIRPCQCPPPQVCGNGVIEEPEQCDLGFLVGPATAEGNCVGCNPDCSCPPEAAVCGNNLLEYGEDCDGTLTLEGTAWDLFKTRKYGCSPGGCAIPQPMQPDGKTPLDGWSDDLYAEYLNSRKVDSFCKCPTECKQSPPGPVLLPVKPVRFMREIQVNWTDECINENARAYNVYRCTADGPGGEGCDPIDGGVFSIINQAPLGITEQFVDTNFEGSDFEDAKYYCYRVKGIYGEMITDDGVQLSEFDPEIHCIRAGMEQCFDFREYYPWASEFCSGYDYHIRSTCDDDNNIVSINWTGEVDEQVDCSIPEVGFGDIVTYFTCVGPYAEDHSERPGQTQCVPKSLCDYCNDPFGLFGYSSTTGISWGGEIEDRFLSPADSGSAPRRQPTDLEERDRAGYWPCFQLEMCYMDYSYTNVNKFYQYDTPPACYDFHSESACRKFNDTTGGGLCEWEWHPVYAELGVGVCRTSVVEQQECERCHDPENEVFNRCDRESCSMYGRCYYDKANLDGEHFLYSSLAEMTQENPFKSAQKESDTAFYKCTHERNITCESYDTMTDCIGSQSPYSIEGLNNLTSNVDIDVSGNMSGAKFIKTAGTNTITTPSDDFFSFSKCQWVTPYFTNTSYYDEEGVMVRNVTSRVNPGCIKNSDDSPVIENEEGAYGINLYSAEQYSDCGGKYSTPRYPGAVPNIRDCWKDFDSPITNIPHFYNETDPMRISGNFELQAIVHDAELEYSSHYPDTYVCVAEEGLACYPNGTADKLGREMGNFVTYENVGVNTSYNFSERGFQSGRHRIMYFSEDISHNLEEVKEFPVYIDADAPNMVIEFTNTSFETSEDVWATNLTMNMRVEPRYSGDDEFAFCNAGMKLGNVSIYSLQNIVNEYNNTWTREYSAMHDDYYIFWYRCEDDVGNVAQGNITVLIDGDKSLTNPQPRGTFSTGNQIISIETGTNAECRYLHSVEDNPAFESYQSFDPAVFETMTRFSVTGSEAAANTVHRSEVSLGHGYHRYYVKCRMFNDGKIRGNNADEIRFAVDNAPPFTQFSTDVSAYNSWYNQNIKVRLVCGDPPVEGAGLDWAFGCDSSYYCKGIDCARSPDEFRKFSEPVTLNQTTYISYYSIDKGGNAEPPVENIIFQIDKTPPEITVDFYDGARLADVLVMNIVYRVRVSSSKPLISPAVDQPMLVYTTEPSKFADTIELLPTTDPSVWEGLFYLENINANRGFEGDGLFTAAGVDYHNVSGSGTTRVRIDTKPPEEPVLEPSLEDPSPDASDYQLMGYPVHYYNGTYYTSETSLFITGYTEEYLDMFTVSTVEGVSSELIFTQTPTHVVYEDSILSGFAGQPKMSIFGDVTRRVNNSMYAGFDSEQIAMGPRIAYGHYGMFYDLTKLEFRGGDEQLTEVSIYPGLDESLEIDKSVFFYDKETPSYWFGFDVPLAMFRNTSFYLKSYDDAFNIVRYPSIRNLQPYLVFFSDPIAPEVLRHYPMDGSTSKTTMDIEVVVKEGRAESGIYDDSIEFIINGEPVSYLIEHDLEREEADLMNYYYRIYYPVTDLADGIYDVSVEGADLALNSFNEEYASSHWTFIVDRAIPANPVFTLIDGFKGEGEDRWYARTTPGFIIDFSNEPNPVTIVDTMMEETPTEGNAATCTRVGADGIPDVPEEPVDEKYWEGTIYSSENPGFSEGSIHDTIEEGETKNYSFNNNTFEVTALVIADHPQNAGVFRVNGRAMGALREGDIKEVSDGVYIMPVDWMPSEDGPETADTVEFYLGNFTGEFVEVEEPAPAPVPAEGGDANIFRCLFNEPKLPQSEMGVFWADYGVSVKAYKILDDGTESPTGNWGPFPFTVDNVAPIFTPVIQPRFMDNINLTIWAIVTNERHRLFADIEILGEHHAPYYSSKNGTVYYYFMWDVKDYDKSDEGPTTLTLTLSDFAHNARSVTVPVYLDLTAPRIADLSIDISNTVPIGTELFTSNPNVTVSGRFIDDDIDKVWIAPGDFNQTTGMLEGSKDADINYRGDIPESFTVSVRLIDPAAGTKLKSPEELRYLTNILMINQINNMTLSVRDQAGHVSHRSLKVISDLAAPLDPNFCIGDDWFRCLPPSILP